MLPKKYLNISSGIEHQKTSNWCTNHAVSSLVEAQFAKVYGKVTQLSNSWGMMLSKKTDGKPHLTGTVLENLMDEVTKYGMCPESLYPTWDDKDYEDNKFLPTNSNMYKEALKYKPGKRVTINSTDIEKIKSCVVNDCGCVLVIRVYKEHLTPWNGFIEKPEKGSSPDGRHAIWLCGYIEGVKQTVDGKTYENWFILQESYGNTRGYKGYLFVPYEAFTEKWTGLYSAETYIDDVFTFKTEGYKYPTFHDNNTVIFPRKKLTFIVNKKQCEVDGNFKTLSYPPIVENGTTLVPFRFLCENLGYSVRYDSVTKTISAFSKNRSQNIIMTVGSKVIKSSKCGKETTITSSVPVKVVQGNTLIPLRAFSELTEAVVEYLPKDKKIIIDSMI